MEARKTRCDHEGYDCSGGVEPRLDPRTYKPLGMLCQAHYGDYLRETQTPRLRPLALVASR